MGQDNTAISAGEHSAGPPAAVIGRLLTSLPLDGHVVDVRVGPFWTAVAVETERGLRAGLSSTQMAQHLEHGRPAVCDAGLLIGHQASELAALAAKGTVTERSIGFAALNALLDPPAHLLADLNAEDIILKRGEGQQVAIVGHFPFVPRVRAVATECWVLELSPGEGDLPADRASDVIPHADVVAITGMTLVNDTFESLIRLCRPDAYVLLLGATVPLSCLLFEVGVAAISGTLLTDIPRALAAVSQGANFRQIPGKRLVTMRQTGI